MQNSLKTTRLEGKMHTTPLKRLAKVQILFEEPYFFYFFFNNLKWKSIDYVLFKPNLKHGASKQRSKISLSIEFIIYFKIAREKWKQAAQPIFQLICDLLLLFRHNLAFPG